MRLDQYHRLQALAEELADVVINDADPKVWVGHGKKPNELTQQERGDAYWCRKMAVSSISVLTRVETLIGQAQERGGVDPAATPDPGQDEQQAHLDKEIAAAEKEAARLLSELQHGTAKAAFDARTHGKR